MDRGAIAASLLLQDKITIGLAVLDRTVGRTPVHNDDLVDVGFTDLRQHHLNRFDLIECRRNEGRLHWDTRLRSFSSRYQPMVFSSPSTRGTWASNPIISLACLPLPARRGWPSGLLKSNVT